MLLAHQNCQEEEEMKAILREYGNCPIYNQAEKTKQGRMISKVNEHFWLTKIAKHRKKWRQFFESVEIVPLIIKLKERNKK